MRLDGGGKMVGVAKKTYMSVGYALGNSAGLQPWKTRYQPRNSAPWVVIDACWARGAQELSAQHDDGGGGVPCMP